MARCRDQRRSGHTCEERCQSKEYVTLCLCCHYNKFNAMAVLEGKKIKIIVSQPEQRFKKMGTIMAALTWLNFGILIVYCHPNTLYLYDRH